MKISAESTATNVLFAKEKSLVAWATMARVHYNIENPFEMWCATEILHDLGGVSKMLMSS